MSLTWFPHGENRGCITQGFTMWCARCSVWFQTWTAKNKSQVKGEAIERGWRKGPHEWLWYCPHCNGLCDRSHCTQEYCMERSHPGNYRRKLERMAEHGELAGGFNAAVQLADMWQEQFDAINRWEWRP